MNNITYDNWQIHPHVLDLPSRLRTLPTDIWQHMTTKHEGNILYHKFWNFWVRSGVDADTRGNVFFRDYEARSNDTDALVNAIGYHWRKAETEEEVWERIGMVWNWLQDNVQSNSAEYSTISSTPGEWPSIADYARYYTTHGHLVWGTCFPHAHLFATLLGRVIYPRYRFAIAEAHHAENGAPPTATHVFVAAYVADRWFYMDPTAIYLPFPDFSNRQSVGVSSFSTVDYEHPYCVITLPTSELSAVPYLPA